MSVGLGIVLLVVVDAIAIAALLAVRRKAPEGGFFTDGDRAAGVFGVVATGFALLAGFVVFLAFTQYDDSRSGAEAEALVVVQQFETAQFLPAATRDVLSDDLVCYARYVVEQEWPRMEDGNAGDTLSPWSVALFRGLKSTKARSALEQSALDKWLDQTTDREEARRDRVHGAEGIIPASIWIALFLLAAVVFGFMLFFADRGELARSQAMLIGSGTTVLVVTLLAINALDNPYKPGVGSLKPTAMERSLDQLDQARALVEDRGPLPCDEKGAEL